MSLESDTFDFIERCGEHVSVGLVLSDLLSNVRRFGFEHLILSGVPVGGDPLEPLVDLNGWPHAWFERYSSRNYAAVDGVCRYCAVTTRPFFWSDVPERLRRSPASARISGEAAEFGLVSGYVVPAFSRFHWQSVLSLASPYRRHELSKRELAAINLMAGIAVGTVESIRERASKQKHLSRREKETLRWAARGKSADEIACILSISVPTVRKHLQRSRETYGVTSTLGAVAEALRRRHISL